MSSFNWLPKNARKRGWPLLALPLALGACGRNDVRVYEVPKEPPSLAQGALPPGHPDTSMPALPGMRAPEVPRLTYTKPADWTEVAPGQMRVASFKVQNDAGQQADVSVIPLPGRAGGDESNVNRWRGQVGLGDLSAEELAKIAEPVEVAGQPGKLYDVAGTSPGSGEPTRILGVIQHRDDMAWFYKMTGDDALVAGEKGAFVAFLKSVKFATPYTAEELGALPAGHPEISGAAGAGAASVTSAEGKPHWTVPAGWKEIPGGPFLVAKFTVGEEKSATVVNVSMSAGDGGGLLANVNRWRGQLGLSPWSEAEARQQAKELALANGTATLVEMSGTDGRTGQPATVVGAMLPRDGQTWFYKLMGDAQSVASQKSAFTHFVQEVKY